MKKAVRGVALLSSLCLIACMDLNVPNYNDVSAEDLAANPTRSSLAAATQGLLAGQRGLTAALSGWIGIWGRELYHLASEPRYTTNPLILPLDGTWHPFWFGPYSQIRNIRAVLAAVDSLDGVTDPEKAGVKGLAYTLWAEALFHVNLMHGELGCPITTPDDTRELSPIVAEDAVYAEVLRLFDEGATQLQVAGSSFLFTLPPDMSDFNTPAGFYQVNRALKARTLKYLNRWNEVLSTPQQSFLDVAAPLTFGVWHSYSTNPGDAANALGGAFNAEIYAHPRYRSDAQLQPDGSLDQRALDKTYPVTEFRLYGIRVTEQFGNWIGFSSLSDPRPWIRNEELILLRAEANHALENDDAALADVNLIRTASGRLAPIGAAEWNSWTDDERLTEILYNKFMSLVLEGGFTYLDHRQYRWTDRLPRAKDADTGEDLGHVVFPRFPYPQQECVSRGIAETEACQPVHGN